VAKLKTENDTSLYEHKSLYERHQEMCGHESWCYVNPGERKVKEERE
jgi:hypothetical protein